MADGTSLIDAGSIAAIKQLSRDAMATGLAMGDPATPLVFFPPGSTDGNDPVYVVLRFDKRSGQLTDDGTDAGGESPVTGRIKAFEPWDVVKGTTFKLPDGRHGELTFVQPARGGIVRAAFELDTGR